MTWTNDWCEKSAHLGGRSDEVMNVTDQPFNEHTYVLQTMAIKDIEGFKEAWNALIQLALTAGVDEASTDCIRLTILMTYRPDHTNPRRSRLSSRGIPVICLQHSGRRYGGRPFKNRVRLLLEVVDLTHIVIPGGVPLMIRIPGSDWLEYLGSVEEVPHWGVTQAANLSVLPAEKGVDWIDVATGGLDSSKD
ncbi:uncharacterized protein Z518_05434 [Rhinocladiella mackenziei CBS 650.93]|uniref:Uncharacterized protein n=1 Tax=Rhinocladiella mackenziei CBS 650.93 TaxID=1442369 RepID=A0A0D2IFH6_9EURO|nr:uncharacterized protein Z518_05434 [Rhinocladiella mackenziei CBS 650.93]KIX04564.1 hypothetical protein Z518_05434 [Rhinocladiella mackenziei CBS 650.93]